MTRNSRPAKFVPKQGEIQPDGENNIGTEPDVKQATAEHIFVMASAVRVAVGIARGVSRYFRDLNAAVLTELPLADRRRCDLIALDEQGGIAIVEIKSSLADFRSDQKWPDYRLWCDRFYFAVNAEFPRELVPEDCGLIIADRFGAEVVREAPEHRLAGARRKALTLRFARCCGFRLQERDDPELIPVQMR